MHLNSSNSSRTPFQFQHVITCVMVLTLWFVFLSNFLLHISCFCGFYCPHVFHLSLINVFAPSTLQSVRVRVLYFNLIKVYVQPL